MGTRTSESGFTLVELMIASMITLVVMSVAFSTFRDALALNDAVSKSGDSARTCARGTNHWCATCAGGTQYTQRRHRVLGTECDGASSVQVARWRFLQERRRGLATLSAITTGAGLGPTIRGRATDIVTNLMDEPYLDEMKLYPAHADARATIARSLQSGCHSVGKLKMPWTRHKAGMRSRRSPGRII